jgi:hypothetical protein
MLYIKAPVVLTITLYVAHGPSVYQVICVESIKLSLNWTDLAFSPAGFIHKSTRFGLQLEGGSCCIYIHIFVINIANFRGKKCMASHLDLEGFFFETFYSGEYLTKCSDQKFVLIAVELAS